MTPLTHADARRDLHHGRRWLDNKAAAALDAHLAQCAECRAYAADLAALEPALARALHARWDGVQAPRAAPKASEAETRSKPPRRLNPAWGLAGFAVLLVAVLLGLPYLAGQPLEGTGEPPVTLGPVATGVAGLPSPTPRADITRALFVADVGEFAGEAESTTVQSPPRVVAWDPVSDQLLWSTEVGLQPRIAVDRDDGFVFVISQYKAGAASLAGLTYAFNDVVRPTEIWPLRLVVLDPISGNALQTMDLGRAYAGATPVGALDGRFYLYRADLGVLDSIEWQTGTVRDERVRLCTDAYPRYVQLAPDGSAVYAFCTPNVASARWWVQITRLIDEAAIIVNLPSLGSAARWGNGLLLSHDGTRLYLADTLQGFLAEIDTLTGEVLRTTQYKPVGRQGRYEALMALAPNGRLLYLGATAGLEPDLVIWAIDTETLQPVGSTDLSPAIPRALAVRLNKLYVAIDLGIIEVDVLGGEQRDASQQMPASTTQLIPYPSNVPDHPVYQPPDLSGLSHIAFESNRDGDSEIYVMNADGSDARNLTQRPGPDRAPVWSPDGRYLAYLADRGDATDVMVLNVENALGTTDIIPPVRVLQGATTTEVNDRLEWSPDGTRLAVSGWRPTGPNTTPVIQLLDVDAALEGVDSPPPVELAYNGYDPKFSPDGTRLLYGGFTEGAPRLFVEDLTTGEQGRFPANESSAPGEHWTYQGYDWSPDGRFVAYLRVGPWTGQWPDLTLARDARAEIVTAPADGSDHSVVATLGPELNGIVGLEYAPNGRYLMFVADELNNGCWKVHLFSLDLVLTQLHGICYASRTALPSWSPDSRLLVFSGGWGDDGRQVEVTGLNVLQALADPANAQPIRLTHWVGDDLSPQWRP